MARSTVLTGFLLVTFLAESRGYTRLGRIVKHLQEFEDTAQPEAERIKLGHEIVADIVDHINPPVASLSSRWCVVMRQAVDRMVNDHAATFDEDLTLAIRALREAASGLDDKFKDLRSQMEARLRHMEKVLEKNVEKVESAILGFGGRHLDGASLLPSVSFLRQTFSKSSKELWQLHPEVQQRAYSFRFYFLVILVLVVSFPVFLYFYHMRLLAQEAKFKKDESGHMIRTNSGRLL
eukprot:scaffold447_cov307-Pinguiococcus_pyrenoidosus.AAC.90